MVRFTMSRCPSDGGHVDCQTWPFKLRRFDVILHQFGCDANNVLTLPIFDHVHRLQSRDDVALSDARHVAKQKRKKW